MGKMTRLNVEIDQEESFRGRFPLLNEIRENGIIPLCGDSVELRLPEKIDTVKTDNGLKISFSLPVQSFDSGYYQLPAIAYVSGVDTFLSNKVSLKVLPVSGVTAETPIADYANVAEPANKSVFDAVPDWILDFWWLILILLLAIAFGMWVYIRYRKTGYIIPPKPQPTPYEEAISRLRELKEKKLWEQGMEKEYFTDLTDILRYYLYRRFGINAVEMTSRQILGALSTNKETKDKRQLIRQILDMADFVKFAKVRPLPADNIASYENALKFVEETKPVEPDPSELTSSDKEQTKAKKAKNNDKRKGGKK